MSRHPHTCTLKTKQPIEKKGKKEEMKYKQSEYHIVSAYYGLFCLFVFTIYILFLTVFIRVE